ARADEALRSAAVPVARVRDADRPDVSGDTPDRLDAGGKVGRNEDAARRVERHGRTGLRKERVRGPRTARHNEEVALVPATLDRYRLHATAPAGCFERG